MTTSSTTTGLRVEPVAGHIGAEVSGVDLTQPLSSATVAALKKALLTYKVLFFHGQHLDHAAHVALARQFGTPTAADPHEPGIDPQFPEILTVDPRVDEHRYGEDFEERFRRRRRHFLSGWHIDNSATVNPPAASILRADIVPAYGGDTHWTNLVAAYEGLSPPLRRLVDGLWAQHQFLAGFDMPAHDPQVASILTVINARPHIAEHPVVRVIPETGERALFLSPSTTSHIVDLTTAESAHLLDLLYQQLARDEYRVRLRWRPGTVAMWDNRTTAHLAALDHSHLNVQRRLYRVTLTGDVPVSPDGRPSRVLSGELFTSSGHPDGSGPTGSALLPEQAAGRC
ncbi:TauD/TfdA dioxygenase family protein [Phytohabitans aurantiacus]|uniref:Taurine dioxygenase n=1 Tax=Phytohabitans aurantiacus TaxID=3016789 RepID=A0ABQ5RBA7_9ACTN|nr:TauD/TfdA family dioxygenase [Phytohabitans aurantiacus]GLI03896.1 taurine dioxygenase [Phytohabitans aurantiacus]